MGIRKKLKKYIEENLNEVKHTTINPDGPGAVRIHMIPPKIDEDGFSASVVIVNGQDIIPVNLSWSVLLNELIDEVNKYHGKSISEWDSDKIVDDTVNRVRKIYPFLSKRLIKRDIFHIMNTFTQVAYGIVPEGEIDYMDIGSYAPYMQAPHRMDLLVSAMVKDGKWHCNQNCLHCYAAGQELVSEEELGTDDWKKIIDKCREAMIPQITFTGGEPTMREDIFELIDYSKWFVTRLNTNGIKLTKDYCKKLYEVSLDSCQITFYSYDKEIHNKLVGADQYESTLAGIENAIEAGLNISINTPLCSLNKDYVKTLKFLKDKGVTYVTCSGLITTGNACSENSVALQLSSEEIKEVLAMACDFCAENDMELSFTSPGWIEEEFFEKYSLNKPTCGACLSNMAITPSGNVVPCQSYLSDKPLGNMLRDNFKDIWNSERCSEHRNYSVLMTGKCPLRIYSQPDNNEDAVNKEEL